MLYHNLSLSSFPAIKKMHLVYLFVPRLVTNQSDVYLVKITIPIPAPNFYQVLFQFLSQCALKTEPLIPSFYS